MTEKSLGVIVVSGGPVRLTTNEDDPTETIQAHSYRVQHWASGNTGRAYLGGADINGGSGEGVVGFLPTLVEAQPWPIYESQKSDGRQNPFDLSKVYIDADSATDQFLVTYVQV